VFEAGRNIPAATPEAEKPATPKASGAAAMASGAAATQLTIPAVWLG